MGNIGCAGSYPHLVLTDYNMQDSHGLVNKASDEKNIWKKQIFITKAAEH